MADIFLSYAREDQAVARRVARALQTAGFELWWDADLPAHRAYSEVIERNLEEAKAVVVLWSATAGKSQWVRAEADFARNAGKLVQANIDGTLPPMPFNQIQCANLHGWRSGTSHPGWAKLQASVQALVSGEERAVPIQTRASLWGRLQPYRIWAAAAIALVVAAGVFLYAFGISGEQHKPVLAVLPFRSLDAQDESLVAGIWEDTRQAIGRNPQLIVLGPKTAQELANKGAEATKKAADYLLEASVRTAGDRIRISADLVRTKDGQQLWSQDFDRKLDDVFALQSEIAQQIEGRIRGRLAEKGGITPEHIATSGEVYALYSDARAKFRKRDARLYPAARDQLEQVVKMDPNFAPAWATLAEVYGLMVPSQKGFTTVDPSETYARKAIDLAPNLAAGHSALAFALQFHGPIARAELEHAVQLDPNDYEALNWLAGMLKEQGRKKEGIETLERAVEIEPLFWPAVLNLYSSLSEAGDEDGIRRLLDNENRLGADYLASNIEMDHAWEKGELAKAANIGLTVWNSRRPEAQTLIGLDLWAILLQLGYGDEVFSGKIGPAPDFAPYLWRNDPKGLEMVESHHLSPKMFLTITPLVQNAGRVYLLTGRAQKLADTYLSLNIAPEQFAALFDDREDFLSAAPLIAIALQRTGHARDAQALLALAETGGKDFLRTGKPQAAAWLARIYAVQGRKDEALSLLTSAVNRRWLPAPPVILTDLAIDPAFAALKADSRFEALRQQIVGTIARERARVNIQLLRQVNST